MNDWFKLTIWYLFYLGSGIGFMVIAGIVCDVILMYIHKSRNKYREGKISVCEVDEHNPMETRLLIEK